MQLAICECGASSDQHDTGGKCVAFEHYPHHKLYCLCRRFRLSAELTDRWEQEWRRKWKEGGYMRGFDVACNPITNFQGRFRSFHFLRVTDLEAKDTYL